MNDLSMREYQLLFEKAQIHFKHKLNDVQIRQALDSFISIFSGFEIVLTAGFSHVIVKQHKMQAPIDIITEMIPALVTAHMYFGDSLPKELIRKLTNKTQISDTIFELNCISFFQGSHKIVYEPKLRDGKVPDLMISLHGESDVYIECKSQHISETEYHRIFNKFTSDLFAVIKESSLPKVAFDKGLRMEVYLSKTPNKKEIAELEKRIESISMVDLKSGVQFNDNIKLIAKPKEEAYDQEPSMHIAEITVTDRPTKLHHENAHLVIYSWPSLDAKRRRSQRELLKKARKKLMNVPNNSIGMICMQLYGVKNFIKYLKSLLSQDEFSNIPFVWLNPFHESRLVFRNDNFELMNILFKGLISR